MCGGGDGRRKYLNILPLKIKEYFLNVDIFTSFEDHKIDAHFELSHDSPLTYAILSHCVIVKGCDSFKLMDPGFRCSFLQ